jgi:hypothetical protein
VTLDALLEAEGLSAAEVGMVWIDVQGHELAVLRGARSLLAEHIPVVVEQSRPSDEEWGELMRGYASVSLGRGAADDVLFLRAGSRPNLGHAP